MRHFARRIGPADLSYCLRIFKRLRRSFCLIAYNLTREILLLLGSATAPVVYTKKGSYLEFSKQPPFFFP